MSYNGIGLNTARGSGTNGYVQRNLSNLHNGKRGEFEGKHYLNREIRSKQTQKREQLLKATSEFSDEGLAEHERKRKIEVKVMQLRDELEDNDELEDEEIDKRVDEYRTRLLNSMDRRDRRERYGTQGAANENKNNNSRRNERRRSVSPTGQTLGEKEEHVDSTIQSYDKKLNPFEKKQEEGKNDEKEEHAEHEEHEEQQEAQADKTKDRKETKQFGEPKAKKHQTFDSSFY